MSSGDRAQRTHGMRGYTIMEISVVLVLLTGMSLIVERTLTSTNRADAYMRALRRAKQNSETISFTVYEAVSASRRLFDNDDVGQAYLAALDLSNHPMAASGRLPRIDAVNPLGPDAPGDPRTGNVLFFVREVDPIVACADLTKFPQRMIDVYHFVCCYPEQTDRRLLTADPNAAKDLVVWYSVAFPSYQQIMGINDSNEQLKLLEVIRETYGFEFVWDVCCPVGEAFYRIQENGQLATLPETDFLIPEDPGISEGGLLAHRDAQLARTDASQRLQRSVFTVDSPATWVPDGFEVKISGTSGHRKVWIHTVVETGALRGESALHGSTLIASVRDL